MKTLYYLFLIRNISKSLQRHNTGAGSALLDAIYRALLDEIFGAKK